MSAWRGEGGGREGTGWKVAVGVLFCHCAWRDVETKRNARKASYEGGKGKALKRMVRGRKSLEGRAASCDISLPRRIFAHPTTSFHRLLPLPSRPVLSQLPLPSSSRLTMGIGMPHFCRSAAHGNLENVENLLSSGRVSISISLDINRVEFSASIQTLLKQVPNPSHSLSTPPPTPPTRPIPLTCETIHGRRRSATCSVRTRVRMNRT